MYTCSIEVSIIFKEARKYQLRRRMKQAQSVSGAAHTLPLRNERRAGDRLQPAVPHSWVEHPRQKLDIAIKHLIGHNMEPLLLGLQRTLQNCRPFHWCCACLSLQYDAIGHATRPKTRCCGSSETHTGSMGLSVTSVMVPSNVFEMSGNVFLKIV